MKSDTLKVEHISVVLPKWLKDEIRIRAATKGINMSEYLKDVLKREVQSQTNQTLRDEAHRIIAREVQSQPSQNPPAG